ncbi:MAG: HEAT repeat domain-containing protein, partial [Phycisphaerales bacterium]
SRQLGWLFAGTDPIACELTCCNLIGLSTDKLPIVFTITNRDARPYAYDTRDHDRSGRLYEYELRARRHDGKPVPDPREEGLSTIGGGLGGGIGHISTGGAFQKTIVLNLWARIIEPGLHSITGIYHDGFRGTTIRVRSSPIEIRVMPRSYQQMGEYIAELTRQLKALPHDEKWETEKARQTIVARLAYTCDPRIVPLMLDLIYEKPDNNTGFEAFRAFCCYLPPKAETRAAVLNAIETRGLIYEMGFVMRRLGVSETDAAEVIRPALASNDRETVGAALTVLQEYPADEYTPRLVAIALDPNSVLPYGSIWALATHRTDEGVAALRKLLNDPNPEIRKTTARHIRTAYFMHPHYPEQVDAAYTATLASVAADPNHQYRYRVLPEIVRTRTRDGVKAVQMLLADPNAQVAMAETDPGVRVIRDLLRHADPDVREIAREQVKWACYESPGRALRLDDFPAEFHEDLEARKKRVLEQWLKSE